MTRILLLTVFLSVILQSCYLLEQSSGQLSLRFKQIEIDDAIQKPEYAQYKSLLLEVKSIKRFAEQTLQLKKTENYSGYYHTEQPGITYVVTASPKNKLEPYSWWFPIIGSVPYKGFFDKTDALDQEQSLIQEGYDTYLFAAPAYSSLGWFKDPITTPMLKKGLYYLTDTIIHEMVHVTVYIDGQGDFNEQLAAFVAKKGTQIYIKRKKNGEAILNQHRQKIESQKRLYQTTQKYINLLSRLYQTEEKSNQVLIKRQNYFDQLKTEVHSIYPQSKKSYWTFNNARLLQFRRYQPENELFEEIWKKSGEQWPLFWKNIDRYASQQGWD